jgi:hypothetical protein
VPGGQECRIVVIAGALLLVGLTVYFILQPVLSGQSAPLYGTEEEPTEAQFRKRVSLLQLRDAEYEFAMGKLGDEDYQTLRKELSAEALAAIRAEEAEESGATATGPDLGNADLEAEIAAIRSRLSGGVFCSECGHPNAAGSRFCAECGSKLLVPGTAGRA